MDTKSTLIIGSLRKKTTLDKAYDKYVFETIKNHNEEVESRWETYNLIIDQLNIQYGNNTYNTEIKYRVTDGEDPNVVILDIISRGVDEVSGLIFLLKRRLEEYVEDDFYRRFHQ